MNLSCIWSDLDSDDRKMIREYLSIVKCGHAVDTLITQSLKVRRNVVDHKYKNMIEMNPHLLIFVPAYVVLLCMEENLIYWQNGHDDEDVIIKDELPRTKRIIKLLRTQGVLHESR